MHPPHRVTSLVIPIFRRYWLWTPAMTNPHLPSAAQAASTLKHWRQGATLEEKFALLGQRVSNTIQDKLFTEWQKLERAREGSFRNRMYRLAQAVLSREDPQETFLKSVPTKSTAATIHFTVMYPEAYNERLMRRRLRILAMQGRRRHRQRAFWWTLALIPQAPLMLTPLPNVTVYYTIYRMMSHFRAVQGGRALERGFALLDSEQLASLRDELLRLQTDQGFEYPPDSWPAKLIKKQSGYLDIFDRLRRLQKQRRLEAQLAGVEEEDNNMLPSVGEILDAEISGPNAKIVKTIGDKETNTVIPSAESGMAIHKPMTSVEASKKASTGMRLLFEPSKGLAELVDPAARLKSPLSDGAALEIGKQFEVPHLLEFVARARRRAVGSMFPADSEEWQRNRAGTPSGEVEKS